MTQLSEHRRIYKMCKSCMRACYSRKPDGDYIERGAMLLFGTAAHESDGFKAVRQYGFGDPDDGDLRGGFSWWQVQMGSVSDSMDMLRRKPDLAERCADWLWQRHGANLYWFDNYTSPVLATLLMDWQRFGCLFARLHYMRDPNPIPSGLGRIATYYKDVYNTRLGKATPQDFTAAWCAFGVPALAAIKGGKRYA